MQKNRELSKFIYFVLISMVSTKQTQNIYLQKWGLFVFHSALSSVNIISQLGITKKYFTFRHMVWTSRIKLMLKPLNAGVTFLHYAYEC